MCRHPILGCCMVIVVHMIAAQHCQLLILGCDIAQTYCLQVSCISATGMYARNRRKQSGLTQSQELDCNQSSLPTPRAS